MADGGGGFHRRGWREMTSAGWGRCDLGRPSRRSGRDVTVMVRYGEECWKGGGKTLAEEFWMIWGCLAAAPTCNYSGREGGRVGEKRGGGSKDEENNKRNKRRKGTREASERQAVAVSVVRRKRRWRECRKREPRRYSDNQCTMSSTSGDNYGVW
jgi:hypothetical protein